MAAKKTTATTTTTKKTTSSKVAAPVKGKAKAPAKKGAKKAAPAKANKPEKEKKWTPKKIALAVGGGLLAVLGVAAYGNHKEEKGYTAGLEAKLDQVTTEQQTTVTKTEEEQN